MSWNIVNKNSKVSQIRATSNATITINDLTHKVVVPGTVSANLSLKVVTGGGTAFDNTYVGQFLWNNANVFIGQVNNVVNATSLVLTRDAAVTANTPFSVGSQAVLNFNISKVLWSTANTITVYRGSTTVGDLQLRYTGDWQLDSAGFQLAEGSTANLNIVIPDAASTLLIEVHKDVRQSVSQYLGAER